MVKITLNSNNKYFIRNTQTYLTIIAIMRGIQLNLMIFDKSKYNLSKTTDVNLKNSQKT